jgi:hypothetical protein
MALARHSTFKVITSPCSSLSCTRHVQAFTSPATNSAHPLSSGLHKRHDSASNSTHKLAPRRQHPQSISRCRVTCAAGRQGSASEADMLPDSREEAISQACTAITANLPSIKSQKSKKKYNTPASAPGFAGETKKLSVEIPVADESQDAAMALAKDVVSGLPSPWPNQFTYVVCSNNTNTALATANVVTLDACLQDESDSLLGSCIVIIAPKATQVAAVEQLMGRWRGSVCVLLNAEWAPMAAEEDLGSIDSVHTAFVRSFKAVYCFMPLLIKAFVVSTQEGAIFRFVGGNKKSGFSSDSEEGAGADPWRIFMRQNNSWEPVARMQRRPSSTEVEVSFYNASAANSPLTKGAKFLKGLVNKQK